MKKLLVLALLCGLSFAAQARDPVIVAVGTDASGTQYVIEQLGVTNCAYSRAYRDSLGRKGCWAAQSEQQRYALFQQSPNAAIRFLPYSNTVTCPPDTATVAECVQ